MKYTQNCRLVGFINIGVEPLCANNPLCSSTLRPAYHGGVVYQPPEHLPVAAPRSSLRSSPPGKLLIAKARAFNTAKCAPGAAINITLAININAAAPPSKRAAHHYQTPRYTQQSA